MMQSMCPICRHSQRSSIDESLRAGRDLRSLADEYGLEASSGGSSTTCRPRRS
jgi:hypothetical protein